MMQSSFFAGIPQTPIDIRGVAAENPLFYRELSMMFAVFSAPTDACAAHVGAPEVVPLELAANRTLVAVQCFEYRHCGVGPYNEVSIAVAVRRREEHRARTLLRTLTRRQFGGFVVDLPVNTDVALHAGLDIFGYPKWRARIEFEDIGDERRCSVRDGTTGELVYAFTGDRLRTVARGPLPSAAAGHGRETALFRTYPVKDGRTLAATMLLNERAAGVSVLRPSAFCVELGTHPAAMKLRSLRLGRLLAYRYVPESEAILFAPAPLL
ncbi:MAG: acetoacetate decarboxylase family protein [Deltaproteobacteria bacterium]|nr:acetoacetate decarboxylase family protein [Deltaproteobacteria bacterium]